MTIMYSAGFKHFFNLTEKVLRIILYLAYDDYVFILANFHLIKLLVDQVRYKETKYRLAH